MSMVKPASGSSRCHLTRTDPSIYITFAREEGTNYFFQKNIILLYRICKVRADRAKKRSPIIYVTQAMETIAFDSINAT